MKKKYFNLRVNIVLLLKHSHTKGLLFLFVLALPLVSFGQTNTWNGSSSTAWNTPANWSLNLVPIAAHDVVIPNVTIKPTISVTGAVCNTLTINNAGANANTLTINGTGTLVVTGAVNINNNATANFDTSISVGSRTLTAGSITMNDSGSDLKRCIFSLSTGTVTIADNITMIGATAVRNQVSFTGAGILIVGGTITGGGFTSGTGTVTYNKNGSQNIGTYTYNNLITTGSGVKSLTANTLINSSLTVKTNTTLDLGSFTLSSPIGVTLESGTIAGSSITGTGLLTLGGNVSVNVVASDPFGASISCPIALGSANRAFTVNNAAAAIDLAISGVISGAFDITKANTGTINLSGTNIYSGATTVTGGILQLGNTAAVGSSSSILVASGAALDLNGITLSTVSPLTLNGTGISSGGALMNSSATAVNYSGLVTLGSASSIISNAGAITIGNAGAITGAFGLTLGGTANGIMTSPIGTSTGTLTKIGTGTWTLSGASTYAGATTVSAGTLKLNNTAAVGSTSGITVVTGAVLDLNGTTLSTAIPLTISGTGIALGGALINSSATAVDYSGLIALGATSSIISDFGAITISNTGTIVGANRRLTLGGAGNSVIASTIGNTTGGLTKSGSGTWTLSGASTYTGTTTVSAGTLKLNNPTGIGLTSRITVTAGAVLDLNGTTLSTARLLTLNGTGISSGGALINSSATAVGYSGLITLGSASSIISNAGTVTISNVGTISGAFALTLGGTSSGILVSVLGNGAGGINKIDSGTWTLSGASTYTGPTSINSGTIKLGATGGTTYTPLGRTNGNTTVASGAVLDLNGFSLGTTEALVLNGIGISSGGALTNTAGNAIYKGAITLASDSMINATVSGSLTCSGAISGAFGLTLDGTGSGTTLGIMSTLTAVTKNGTGTWTFSKANTYPGPTAVNVGTISLGIGEVLAGNLSIASGASFITNSKALTFQGNFTNGGTFTTGSSVITISGTNTQSIAGFSTTGAVAVTKTAGVATFTGVVTTTNSLVVPVGARLNLGSGLIHSANALKLGATTAAGGSWGSTGSTATNKSDTYFDVTGTGIVNNAATPCTPGYWIGGTSVTWNTLANWCNGVLPTATTNVVIPSGTLFSPTISGTAAVCNNLTIDAGATLSNSGSLNINGVFESNGVFAATAGSTTSFVGANQDVEAVTYGKLTLGGTGTKTLTGAIIAAGTVTINNLITLATANNQLTFQGGFINSGTFTAGSSDIVLSGGVAQSIAGFTTTGDVSMIKTAGTATFAGDVSAGGLLLNASSNTPKLDLGTFTHTFAGDLTLTKGTLLATSSTLNIAGDITNGGVFTTGTSTVVLNGGDQSIGLPTFYTLTLGGTGTKTLTTNTNVLSGLSVKANVILDLLTFNFSSPTSLSLEGGSPAGSLITGSGLFSLGGNVTVTNLGSGSVGAEISCPVDLNGPTIFTVADDGTSVTDLLISGSVNGISSETVTKMGAGTMGLAAYNTYTGSNSITEGILQVESGLGVISNTAPINMNGGALSTGGTIGYSVEVGELTLSASSIVALGTGVHSLKFKNSSSSSWTTGSQLVINGWEGLYNGTSGTAGSVFFGNSDSGLTSAQLQQIRFYNASTGFNFSATILPSGEVVPRSTIITNAIGGSPFCTGSNVSVSFSYGMTSDFPSGVATFTAQLSDASGSFATPTILQSVTSDASGNQSINVTIPSATVQGSGYRIRVVSVLPDVIGENNGTNLTINTSPTLTTVAQDFACDGSKATINLEGLVPNSTSTITYTIDGVVQTPSPTVTADALGKGSFMTNVLTVTADNGKELEISSLASNATPSCLTNFSNKKITLSVNSNSGIISLNGVEPTGASVDYCAFTTAIFSIPAVSGATYDWTLPTNWVLQSIEDAAEITVTTGSMTDIGSVSVTVNAFCPSNLGVTLSTVPPTAPSVTVKDISCLVPTGSIEVTSPAPNGTIKYTIIGPSPALTAVINTTGIFKGLAEGDYSVTYQDGATCVSVEKVASVVSTAVVTNTWNGITWSNGTPTLSQIVVFDEDYNEPGSVNACSCIISPDKNVVISATLTIANGFDIQGAPSNKGTLTFANGANLVQANEATNIGDITFKRNVGPLQAYDYVYWTSPVVGGNASMISDGGTAVPNKKFNYASGNWVAGGGMSSGNGCIVRFSDAITQHAVFVGKPNNGEITIAAQGSGSSLIGNPYPSPIYASSFYDQNSSIVGGSLYFWKHSLGREKSADGTQWIYPYDYALVNASGSVGMGDTIDAGVAFFVNATGTFVFNNDMRLSSTWSSSKFAKQANTSKKTVVEKNRVWLNLTNESGAYKQLLVAYITGATNDFDKLYDGVALNGNPNINFYSIGNSQKYTINGRAFPLDKADAVPLGYKTTIDGTFAIAIDKVDGGFVGQSIYIEDKSTNTVYDLTKGAYSFTTTIGEFADRFVLRFTDSAKLGIDDVSPNNKGMIVSVKNRQIKINSFDQNITAVQLFDLKGSLIYEKNKINKNEFVIDTLASSTQFMIVMVQLENGNWVSEEIIFQE